MKRTLTPHQALVKLEELCSRSEQCSYDVKQKLFKWGIPADAAAKIIDSLVATRYIDDRRFALAYTRDKYIFARWGRKKIANGLYAKRIDRSLIDSALASIDNREYAQIAFKVIIAKLRSLSDQLQSFEKRQRLMRFGISRGYETSLIIKILESRKLWEQ
ncbi:MAG: RecX family transcriptional regulator [Barnesiella sp.]|nr:RecX family transcriptional regulator [Barnesiella sp.]